MIVEYIRYQIPDDEADAFEDAYGSAAASLKASPHCERYEVAPCTEDLDAYTVRIEWDSADGHLHGFRRGAALRRPDRGDAPLRGQGRRPDGVMRSAERPGLNDHHAAEL